MIIILAILITWYATKLYYTRDYKINMTGLEEHGLTTAKCSRCSQYIVISEDEMRTPFYCSVCK
jgi:formamidopyrimidine-DNA glycosylase